MTLLMNFLWKGSVESMHDGDQKAHIHDRRNAKGSSLVLGMWRKSQVERLSTQKGGPQRIA